MSFPNLPVLWALAGLSIVGSACTEAAKPSAEAGGTYVAPAGNASRLALARDGDGLVLIELALDRDSYDVLTAPIEGWFQTLDGYSVIGPSAELWASRDHQRAVMAGRPHTGGATEVRVLRDGAWERWETLSQARHVEVGAGAQLVVATFAARGELFSDSVIQVFDYAGDELLSVAGKVGLSTVTMAPHGRWVLVEDGAEAVVVHADGRVVRFTPDLGAAGQSELGWAVSAAFVDRIVFHGYVDGPDDELTFPRVTHLVDGTKVEDGLTDYDRVGEQFVLTPNGELYAVGPVDFERVARLSKNTEFDSGMYQFVASRPGEVLSASWESLSWLDADGETVAAYLPEPLAGASRVVLGDTVAHSVHAGLVLASHAFDGPRDHVYTLDAFQVEGATFTIQRLVELTDGGEFVTFGIQSGSPWLSWATVDIGLTDDHAGAINVVSGERRELAGVPRIESWAEYGEHFVYEP